MLVRASLVGIALMTIASGAVLGQRSTSPADSVAPTLRSFESEAEFQSYLTRIAALAIDARAREDSGWGALCGSQFKITRRSKSTWPVIPSAGVVIRASVSDTAGKPVSGALLDVDSLWVQTTTHENGDAVFVVPAAKVPESHRLSITVRSISYKFRRAHFDAFPGDTIDIAISICNSHLMLQQSVSTAGGSSGARSAFVSDKQWGVDPGEDVRVFGRFLVVLRRGRLFSFDLGPLGSRKPMLRLSGFINLYGAPGTAAFRPYYKLMMRGHQLIVVGYDNSERGAEIHLLHISNDGVVRRTAIYMLRVGCVYVRCDVRLAGGKLALFSTSPLTSRIADSLSPISAMSRVFPKSDPEEFHSLVTRDRIYRFPTDSLIGSSPFLNTITVCDIATLAPSCEARTIIGPRDVEHYVSPSAVYVWTHEGDHPNVVLADEGVITLFRVPLSDRAPQATRLSGGPFDDLSLNEDGRGTLRVFASGDSDYGPRLVPGGGNREAAALFTLHPADFGDGTHDAPASAHRTLPLDDGSGVGSAFVGSWLLYSMSGPYFRTTPTVSTLFAVPTNGGAIRRIKLPYFIESIVPTASNAIVIGTAAPAALHFLRIDPASKSPLTGHFQLDNPSGEEYESYRFDSDTLGSERGLLAIPGSGYRGDSTHWVRGSTSVVFVRKSARGFERIGSLAITHGTAEDDSLEVQSGWADDWYGNARGIFLGERIFALIGYELIEARLVDGRIVERQRINFMPRADQKGWQ